MAGLTFLAIVLRVGAALHLPNIHRPDEVFQTIEPGFRMWSGGGVVTWEWREGIRSPVFPAVIGTIIAVSKALGATTAGYLGTLTVVFSILASITVPVGCVIGWTIFGRVGALVCGFLCAVSPDLVYFGPKLLTEVQAGNLLMAACLCVYGGRSDRHGADPGRHQAWISVMCGLLLGLVFVVRFQLAVAIAVVALAHCGLDRRRRWPFLSIGFLLPIALTGLVDKLYWGSWFQSVWLNYRLNVVDKVSEEYGVQSHVYFFGQLIKLWGVSTIVVAALAVIGSRRAPMLAVLAIAIIASHSLIAHKELSFIYAALPPIVILAGLGTTEVLLGFRAVTPDRQSWRVVAVLALWLALWSVTTLTGRYRVLWVQEASVLKAAHIMAANGDVCGLAVDSEVVRWPNTGGDAYIGSPIPIYAFHTATGVARVTPATNYAIGGRDIDQRLPGLEKLQCWSLEPVEICLARSPSRKTCVADPGFDLNSLHNLGRRGTFHGADLPRE